MSTKSIFYAAALVSLLSGAAAFAQDAPAQGASSPAAQPADAASSATGSAPSVSQDDAIHLHMPVHHRPRRAEKPAATAAPADNPSVDAIGADTTIAPPVVAPVSEIPAAPPPVKPAKTSHKTERQPAATIPFSFGEDSETIAPPTAAPQKTSESKASSNRETRTASLPPKPAAARIVQSPSRPAATPTRTKANEHAGLTKRGAVLFGKGVSNPSPAQFQGVKLLASNLSAALEAGASRIQLEAYGGTPGDKSSEARRLSLKRALAVRQLLIDSGVPSSHIVVRAMGGADDQGPNDRVDVFVSS
ncbi:MAG TPA: OmpA family protein [Rhizomicrobium sp.]|jgi:outer membrane protein OmpA-like peptidoglycan-associated protein|nr:OmpA family protein [Rhizomicrobium sp.]